MSALHTRISMAPKAVVEENKLEQTELLCEKYKKNITDNTSTVEGTANAINSKLTEDIEVFSPNSLYASHAFDRFVLTRHDVSRFLEESAKQKQNALCYAGKYALTPQNFRINKDRRAELLPYGMPPTDGITTNTPNGKTWPIITDSCHEYYDVNSGIHYRWDQFNPSSNRWEGSHWNLAGPVLSVSNDGLKWVTVRLVLEDKSGGNFKTGFFVDRENKLGYGKNAMLVTDTTSNWILPSVWSAKGIYAGRSISPYQDGRIHWDQVVFGGFVVFTLNSQNTQLVVRTGSSLTDFRDAFTYDDPVFSNTRVECPSWVRMTDMYTGKEQQVVSVALQGGGVPTCGRNSVVLGTCNYSKTSMNMDQPFRYVEYGPWAYAQHLVDPLQQDGTGGTFTSCRKAVMNVGCYSWSILNSGAQLPIYGFAGGQHIPADICLVRGIPKCLPNSKFREAMTGKSYKISMPGYDGRYTFNLAVDTPCDVWRATFDIGNRYTDKTSVRFYFGNRYIEYTINNGFIDCNPNNSGTTVPYPNRGAGTGTTRNMPYDASYVIHYTQPSAYPYDNTLVWEYDNGRIRLYNTNTGDYMSEWIFPDGNRLTSVVIQGVTLLLCPWRFSVRQDGDNTY